MTQLIPAPLPTRSFSMVRTVFALMLREMATTYGRSIFGYLWAILEPAAGILLLTFAFSLALQSPPLGTDFSFFYASGMVPFLAYMDISTKTAQSLRFSKPLMAFPAVTFVDAIIARFLLNSLTQLMVGSCVFLGIIVSFSVDVLLEPVALLAALVMLMSLALGVGVLNCFLLSMYPLWERIWGILNRPMFLASGVFFLFESVPEPYSSFLWYNPLIHVIGMLRLGLFATYSADYVSFAYVMGVSLTCLVLGLIMLRRYHGDILDL